MNLNYRPLDYHENKARELKSEKLATALRAVGVPSWNVMRLADETWQLAAAAGKCNPPKDDRTKLMVRGLIEAEEFRQTRMSVREWKARVEAQNASIAV